MMKKEPAIPILHLHGGDRIQEVADTFDFSKPPSSGFEKAIREMVMRRAHQERVSRIRRQDSAKALSVSVKTKPSSPITTMSLAQGRHVKPIKVNSTVAIPVLIEQCSPIVIRTMGTRPGPTRRKELRAAKIETLGINATSFETLRESVHREYNRLFAADQQDSRDGIHQDGELVIVLYLRFRNGWRDAEVKETNWRNILETLNTLTPSCLPDGVRIADATLVARVACKTSGKQRR